MEQGRLPLVLIVDDDRDVVSVLAEVVADEGFRVVTAGSGAEAMHLLRGGLRPGAVFLDRVMPAPGGEDVLTLMKGDPALSAIPVVWMTGDPRAPPPSVAAWLRKPFGLAELLAALNVVRGLGPGG